MNASGRVAGKVIVVTGAAGAQGSSEVAVLVDAGATVYAVDIQDADRPVPGARYMRVDVTQPGDWQKLAREVRANDGRLDGLVNNAGISWRERLADVALEDLNRVFAVNVTGALLGIQTLVPLMGPGSSIVNVGSIAATTSHFGVAYTVSKWALRGLSRVASMELGAQSIRVNLINPGLIETPMSAAAAPAFLDATIALTPLGRGATPDEVAPLVLFLLSDEASFISGAEIAIDGGLWAAAAAKTQSDALRTVLL